MDKFIYALIFALLVLTIVFSYQVKDYKISVLSGVPSSEDKKIETVDMISKPIVFDAQRKFLTAVYREKHTGDCDYKKEGRDACVVIKPQIVILHMTDLDTLDESFDYMKEPVLREEREKLISRSYDRVNVSAQFLVDKDGTIYALMPENYMARHAMGVNHLAIGIENVGLNTKGPTREQVDSDVKLVKYLTKKYDINSKNVYSHAGVGLLKDDGSEFFVERDDNYFIQKSCGEKIIKEVRRRLKAL